MKKKVTELSLVFLSILIFSYLLNFVWESFHSIFLYTGMNFDAKRYVFMINYVSIVDCFVILGIYVFVGIIWKEMFWLRKMNRMHGYAVFIAGILIAAVIEYRNVIMLKVWNYNQFMPTMFGIGISPLFQLSITGLLACWITGRIFYKRSDL